MTRRSVFICGLFVAHFAFVAAQSQKEAIEQFIATTGASVSINPSTLSPDFIRFSHDRPFGTLNFQASAVVQNFLSEYGEMLGSTTLNQELELSREYTDQLGFRHLVFQQYKNGVPVFDGEMKWHFDKQNRLMAVNGIYLPHIKVATSSRITPQEAEAIATGSVKNQFAVSQITASEITLYIYRKGLVQGLPGNTHLAYRITVISPEQQLREFVFVDAHDGTILDQFTGSHSALHRELYQSSLNNLIWEEGDDMTGLDQWHRNEIETAGHMYYLFRNTFGYLSYDNADAIMKTIHQNPAISCPNANWNGTTANYCIGTASDDVVAHEWGHAYTEYTNNLIYAWQPGALNESYSDIWGETVDLLNGYEDTGENLANRTGCNSSHRWLMGEDATAFGSAIRDMWDPTCKGDPGKMSDAQYYCSSGDNGGVHSNSGINNHAYALLVDGGTYNNQTVTGLGFTKAAHIFWRAQKEYLSITSNFRVQADALEAACNDLMGINLEGLSFTETPAGLSGQIINPTDLLQLQKVLLAVEMRMDPPCFFVPLLAESSQLCPESVAEKAIYYEDFESGTDGWTITQIPSNPGTWESREWTLTTDIPLGRTSTAVFAPDPINGDCQTNLQNGILRLESPEITIPVSVTGDVTLAFDHWVATERLWDGGNLKINLNGSGWNLIPTAAFTLNDYNLTLNTDQNDNPLAGQPAFSGSDGGSPDGSWGTSLVNLSSVGVSPGSTVRIRWELGTDGCNGTFGWYVDDISVFSCLDCQDSLTTATVRNDQQLLIESGTNLMSGDEISENSEITYSAGSSLDFQEGFKVDQGSVMEALIEGCEVPLLRIHPGEQTIIPLAKLGKKVLPDRFVQEGQPDLLVLDSTEQKLAMEELRIDPARNELILSQLPSGIFTLVIRHKGEETKMQLQIR